MCTYLCTIYCMEEVRSAAINPCARSTMTRSTPMCSGGGLCPACSWSSFQSKLSGVMVEQPLRIILWSFCVTSRPLEPVMPRRAEMITPCSESLSFSPALHATKRIETRSAHEVLCRCAYSCWKVRNVNRNKEAHRLATST